MQFNRKDCRMQENQGTQNSNCKFQSSSLPAMRKLRFIHHGPRTHTAAYELEFTRILAGFERVTEGPKAIGHEKCRSSGRVL